MVGLGETDEEILQVMRDMRAHDIDMLTIGQYLAPSNSHLPVRRYVHPDTFKMFEARGLQDGLQPRRRGRHGALQLPRRPAGARRWRVSPAAARRQPPCSPPPQMPCHCGATGLRPAATATITSRCSSAWRAHWSWRFKAEGSA